MGLHFLGIYQLALRNCILTGRVTDRDLCRGEISKIPMPQHFLNGGRSLPMINSWLPVICQVTKYKIYMSLKVEVFQPTSFSLLSIIYRETPGKIYLKMLAQGCVGCSVG